MPDQVPATLLYHLVHAARWDTAVSSQEPYYPSTYEKDGFVHLTADPKLLLEVANRFYIDVPGDWMVLVIEASKLTSEVKYEPAAPVGDKKPSGSFSEKEQKWPHLYGTIDFGAVVARLPVQRDEANGKFLEIGNASNN